MATQAEDRTQREEKSISGISGMRPTPTPPPSDKPKK